MNKLMCIQENVENILLDDMGKENMMKMFFFSSSKELQ